MPEQLFCMVSFIGSIEHQILDGRMYMQIEVAGHRFAANPCPCSGCQRFSDKLTSMGASPSPTVKVEVSA